MHVGHMASHVCDTWQAMCVTHGMPCVIMHGPFETYEYGSSHSVWGPDNSVPRGSSKEKEEEGKREREERKGEREEKKRKGKKKKRIRKGRKRGKRKKKRKECCAVRRSRTAKNSKLRYKRYVSSYSGYFTPRGCVMAYEFRSIFQENLYVVWFICYCVMVKDWLHGVL